MLTVPPSVNVPDVVIGEPLTVSPVVPPDKATDETDPLAFVAQDVVAPLVVRTLPA